MAGYDSHWPLEIQEHSSGQVTLPVLLAVTIISPLVDRESRNRQTDRQLAPGLKAERPF